jgi:hypothetical protein
MYTPRTISSSTRRAQSSPSRLVLNVLMTWGQPVFLTMAFQVPEGVLTRVALGRSPFGAACHCTEIVPNG